MPFQIKDFNSIVLAQINHARAVTTRVTDFQPGSVVRTLMEAPAVEIEELYLQMFLGLRDAIPVATFQSFGFDKLAASVAHGFVSISAAVPLDEAIAIPIGTIFYTADGRRYATTASATWAIGSSLIRLPVASMVPGTIGNAAVGIINGSDEFATGYTVSNSLIENGRDAESDADREARFAEFVRSLSRGTLPACLYAAGQAVVLDADGNIYEYVTRVGVSEAPGVVRIYAYTNRGIPTAELLADGQLRLDGSRNETTGEVVPGYRPAGVRVDMLPMVERAVPFSIQVEMLDGYTLNSAVRQSLGDLYATAIKAILPGTVMYIGTVVEYLLAAPGVKLISPVTNSNIVCSPDEALTPGVLTITAIGA